MLQVFPISALQDNYIWCLVNGEKAVIVDPGDAKPVLTFLKTAALDLVAILVTHHHDDHIQGIEALLKFKEVPVYGPGNIPQVTMPLKSPTLFLDAIDTHFTLINLPGHTLEHVAYYTSKIVLTGDTLFTGGCGRVFEGTASQMYESLMKLKTLPDEILIYCGHEYTEANLHFGLAVEPNNQAIIERLRVVKAMRLKNLPTVPATLALEKETNPFLRCEQETVIAAVSKYSRTRSDNPVEIFKQLREWKNNYAAK